MKKIVLLFLCALIFNHLPAQNDNKRGNQWVLGDRQGPPVYGYGGTLVDFNSDTAISTEAQTNHYTTCITTVCEENGQLACFSNGCEMMNGELEVIQGGDNISPGEIHDNYCNFVGYPLSQGSIILPFPGHSNKYILFHFVVDWVGQEIIRTNFLYSVADMSENGGAGEVITANQPLLLDGDFTGHVTATRHGNGRDWWIVIADADGSNYYAFLLSPEGVSGPVVQQPFTDTFEFYSAGQVAFSPDGSWYGENLDRSRMRLMRFDRCSGQFYDPMVFNFPGDTLDVGGVSFSPSNRFMYLNTYNKIFQYDLWSDDIPNSWIQVAEYDGFWYSNPLLRTTFFQSILAPDNKIYYTCTNATWFLHRIMQPDSFGLACDVRQHDFELPTPHAFSVPNQPNYRLYDLEGSICDTLGIDGPVGVVSQPSGRDMSVLKVWPVPASDWLTVEYPEAMSGSWKISDMSGRTLRDGSFTPAGRQDLISLKGLTPGLYFLSFTTQEGATFARKIVVTR